jgi:ribonuclease HI
LVDRLTVHLPGLLPGVRCYTDASLTPDLQSLQPRLAGIGLFIINTQVQPTQTIYIKAKMMGATSVLMAEAAAIALAAIVTDRLNLQQIHFLSDNQQLVQFLSAVDKGNPPDWRIKHFTQVFTNHTRHGDKRILKVHRSQNQTADNLAKQALSQSQPTSLALACTCSNSRTCNSVSITGCTYVCSLELYKAVISFMLLKIKIIVLTA